MKSVGDITFDVASRMTNIAFNPTVSIYKHRMTQSVF